MPLYEGKPTIQEKPPFIFDIGFAYTKFGFAAESSPRCIIASEFLSEKNGKMKRVHEYDNADELYDSLVEFIHILCFRHGLVSPKDRKAVIVESLLSPTIFRETLAKVLFCHFEVAGLLFLPSHIVSLCTLAVETALVVDLGYREVVCIPVYSGVAVLNAWQAQPIAAANIHSNIRNALETQVTNKLELTEEEIEDIKVRTCFVTTLERSDQYLTGSPPEAPPSVRYPVSGKQTITVPGSVRECAFEEMFPRDNEHMGLGNMILDAVMKCPIDTRKELSESILLIGGGSMCLGLKARLKAELLWLANTDRYKDILTCKTFKYHTAPAKANFTAWLGGSIYGGTDLINSRSLSKEMYSKTPHVPDWANLSDNRPPGK